MSYKTGKAKSLDDITLEDVINHPIWVWALDEERVEGQDETWQKPVTSTTNVTEDIFNPTITLRIGNTNYYGSGEYDQQEKELSGLSIWLDGEWIVIGEFTAVPTPFSFFAVPMINGEANVEFVCSDVEADRARRK
jgi:hypothetical protein